MVGSSLELMALPDLRMAIFWDCLHMVGILFSMIGGRDDFFQSPLLFLRILSISLFPDYMMPHDTGLLYTFLLVSLTGNVFCSISSCYASSRC